MNILHLTHTDVRSDSRILKEMRAIAKINTDLKLFGIGICDVSSRTDKALQDFEIISLDLKMRKLKLIPGVIRYGLIIMELYLKMITYGLKIKPDVVHCHDVLSLPAAVIVKTLSRSKLIYDAHELESQVNGAGRLYSWGVLFIEKALWKFVDALIVVSPSIKDWYNENIGKKTIEIILNSPLLKQSVGEYNRQYFRDKFNIPISSKVFLYIGLLTEGRGIDLLLGAFKSKDVTSSLVFLGYGDLSEKLHSISDEHENIFMHEAVPHRDVVDIARSADVGVCLIQKASLSDFYALPNKLFEYSFAGIYVLASNFPDISQVVEKFKMGFCCEPTSSDIYKVVKEIESGRKTIPKIEEDSLYELSWEYQEKKLSRLYKSVAGIE